MLDQDSDNFGVNSEDKIYTSFHSNIPRCKLQIVDEDGRNCDTNVSKAVMPSQNELLK